MNIIARIHTDFPTKFGIPRQSGIVKELKATIVFEPEYRSLEAVRGLEEFSHIWLLWEFSENKDAGWTPTVRPPLLGGNKRMGVFATRSPFRPNPIGLSSVKLERVDTDSEFAPVLHVSGADLMDGTPIYDIKPYVPYSDSHTDASGGFTDKFSKQPLIVLFPEELLMSVPHDKREVLLEVLAQDARPSYQDDSQRIYGLEFAGMEIRFTIEDNSLRVESVTSLQNRK